MLSINTNLSSLIAQRSMKQSTNSLNQAIERMTTGVKINHAKDNAANYNIATNMTTKLGALQVAEDNCAMGLDMLATANDSIALMQEKAERLRALCIQTRNGTYSAQSLLAVKSEAEAIVTEINRIYSIAKYNGVSLFSNQTKQAEATPAVATFGLARAANSDANFIVDPVTYTDEEIEAMLASGDIVVLDDNVTTFTSGQKYLISDETELVRLATLVNCGQNGYGSIFILGADIDLGEYCDQEIANGNGGWTPIGNATSDYDSKFFRGVFDGNGHVIKNLKIDRSAGYQGLFGYTMSSEIKNIGIEGGDIKGKNKTGTFVGYSSSGVITNSYTTVNVTGTGSVGGLIGNAMHTTITHCYTTGNVTGTNGVGGLTGCSYESSSQISNSYAIGDVIGDEKVGGLVGYLSSASLVSDCYAAGNVTGTEYVGGFVGEAYASGPIRNCYATGDITGDTQVGGLVGRSSGSINNSYAIGNVTGSGNVGGLVGISPGSINNSYATGNVTGSGNVGGLAGRVYGDGPFTDNASVQIDLKATQMTLEGINAIYTPESMGFIEANGWTIENGVPKLMLKFGRPSSKNDTNSHANEVGVFLQIGVHGNDSSHISFSMDFIYDLTPLLADIIADEALNAVDNFLAQMNEQSTKLGAIQNRLNSALDEISTQYENIVSSRSTLQDADIAEVSSEYIRQQILQQASATLMSTANQSASIALSLI